jgi:nitrite reductase (NO-forming)
MLRFGPPARARPTIVIPLLRNYRAMALLAATATAVRETQVDLPAPIRRDDDRRVAVLAVTIAGGYLLAAAASALARTVGNEAIPFWLPLHLAFAGGASTAIAGVMPFFAAALAAGRPAPSRLRLSGVLLVATGALLVSVRGVAPSFGLAPEVGGVLYLAGIGVVGVTLRLSGRGGLMLKRPVVTLGYALALVNVGIGGSLGTLAAGGWLPVLERWDLLRPAHAWTNVVGFVSLVIVSTLLHFLPTVLGTRIVARRSVVWAVLAPAMAAPFAVAGLLTGWRPVAGAGAALAVVGAAALVLEARRVNAARFAWTTDPGWHRMATTGLLAGIGWYAIGVTAAAAVLLGWAVGWGATTSPWSSPLVGAPLALGWAVQVLVASWTHLLPSIGPGGPREHGIQRQVLGRAAGPRLLALNLGTALVAIGWPLGIGPIVGAGVLLAAAGVVASAGLAASALQVRVIPVTPPRSPVTPPRRSP